MTRVLLTGTSGFIGRQCLPLLCANGYEVHAIARRIPATSKNSPDSPHVTWHQTDLLSPGEASKAIRRIKADSLLHLAWYAVPGRFWEAPENREWVRSSMELFAAFAEAGGKRLVAAGTCAEYASGAGECFEDCTALSPTTLYGTAKHELQQGLAELTGRNGISAAWGRIFHLYGPYEDPSRLVPYAICALLRGEPALCSGGLQVLDFLHVKDVAAAFVKLLGSRLEGAFNIASGDPVEVRVLLGEIGRQIGRPELIRLGARASATAPERWWGNVEKLTGALGWKPQFDLQRGIADVIQWWRNAH